MDLETIKSVLQIANIFVTLGAGFYVYMAMKDTVTNSRITTMEANLEKKLDEHSERIVKVETRCDNSPTHQDLSTLHNKINNVSDCVSRIEGEFKGANHTLNVLQNYLMNNGGK